MFELEYKGANTVVLSTKTTTVVFDPKLSIVGLKDVKVKNNVEVATEKRFLIEDEAARLIIEGPGEYEIGDFAIQGIGALRYIDTEEDEKQSTIYRIEAGDSRIAVFGNVTAKLTDQQLESIGVVDIAIIPVGGGGYTLDGVEAAALVRSIEPKVVIPVHYNDLDIKYEVPQEGLEAFTKALNAPVETTAKYKVKSASSLPAALTIVELTRTS